MRAKFVTATIVGYTIVIALHVVGLLLVVRSLDDTADAGRMRLMAEEDRTTTTERLRASSELIVAAGRGYIISGDPSFLAKAEAAEQRFSEYLELLRSSERSDPLSGPLLDDIERAEREFQASHDRIVAIRDELHDQRELAERFEKELLPQRRSLAAALALFTAHAHERLERVYEQGEHEQDRRVRAVLGLSAVVLAFTVALAALFSFMSARMYRREQDVLRRAERAAAMRDEMLGVVAHDLRNLLGPIMMRASLLRRGTDRQQSETHAGAIEDVVRRMEFLIRGLLDVASLDAGKFSIAPGRVEVAALLEDTTTLFSGLAATKAVVLRSHLDGVDLAVHADRERVLQILANLVGNAIKFTPRAGTVAISAHAEDMSIRFSVCDEGPGISAEHLPHVFERFWKHEGAGPKGTGLGLFIAKSLVDAHGGRIWAESDAEHGSKFHFTLPRFQPPRGVQVSSGARAPT